MATILCIEDESVMREAIVEMLEDAGYTVLQACDGQDGLEQILTHKPNLVVCDITMPRMDGYQLLKEVREADEVFADMPFIFLSALSGKDSVLKGLMQGADDYISKPVDFDVLKTKIAASLRQIDRVMRQQQIKEETSWFMDHLKMQQISENG